MPLSKTKIAAEKWKLLKLCTNVLEDRKAEDLLVLDVREQSSITDFFIIATATSGPHMRAMLNELERALKAEKVHLVGVDAEAGSGWAVIDAFDVMVHLFTSENRSHYRLESLWKDAQGVGLDDVKALVRERAYAARKKNGTKKTPAKKK